MTSTSEKRKTYIQISENYQHTHAVNESAEN